MNTIDVSGIDRAELLAALYNGTQPMGPFGPVNDIGEMSVDKAQEVLDKMNGEFQFDWLFGRPIKVWIEGDQLHRPDLYDRDAENTTVAEIVEKLRLGERTVRWAN
jgi:hypothetical protein